MISANLYEGLPAEERKLWHSHVYEVKSGMLVLPNPHMPEAAWEPVEMKEVEKVITLYGKVYQLWQTDRGDELPLGEPQLMTSLTQDGQLDEKELEARDAKFGIDFRKKREARLVMTSPEIHCDADQAWKQGGM
ncbi:hypothetical protein CDD82_2550 [Ophiocordyceps australis]|uniref:DUF1264 domain-containing protein n=1 Tax=Ophiocordyceps australis TaxID=1399860 RepID=A0A2C5XUL6_9HYPO|nr:hypothetical protein CDD82_2550 [Ophiocordyceps australis]